MRRFCWVGAQSRQQIECVLDLGCKLIPQLEGKIAVRRSQRRNECIFEHLNCLFRRVDAEVVRLHELQFAIIFGKKHFYVFRRLIIHDVQFWFETFGH
jgi:hypothetical protein